MASNAARIAAPRTEAITLARRKVLSHFMTALSTSFAIVVVGILVAILAYISVTGVRKLNISFLINTPKPIGDPNSGIANAIIGTVILIGLASAVGLPVGIGAGVYLAEYGNNKLGRSIKFLIDVLTGVPSIIAGVVAWSLVVVPMGHYSALAGGVALAVIMLPIVARTTEEMIRLVPNSLREASLALGAPAWRMTLGIVLRSAAPGIATGAMLSIARIAGETAPLLFTAVSYNYISTDINQQMASLTYQIYYYAGSPYDEWHAMAWAATLVLVGMILIVNVGVMLVVKRQSK